ncbi:universal stress protein [Terasakiella sp. A23]|uniref:universal stress protein n=1 Tax=Terasakiella sp. FCG-A23 TaxID=3080561 RepID=UPI00295358E5|nr:universal stress protein [Terasakiella sp. A23]MDV7341492.1 universal stress protein [Terasakiella sp. A23]
MYNKIIIASALDQGFMAKALDVAKALLAQNGQITVVHVLEPVNNVVQSFITSDFEAKTLARAEEMMAERLKDETGIESVILNGQAAKELSEYARNIDADCIVMGSHKPGLEDYFIGSTSGRVVRHAPCCVHVLR